MSGVQTLNIRAIANEVFFKFNTFEIDGHTVTFVSRRFKIENSTGDVVYSSSFPGVEDSVELLSTEEGVATFNKVQLLLDSLLEDLQTQHFSTKFSEDVLFDYGCREF